MKVKTNTSIFVAALVFLLASCENFMTGANIAEDIKDSIKYANASSHTVFVNAEEGRGTFIQGGGSQTLKKGDSFNIEFSVSSAYRFIRWTAVDRLNNSIPRNSFISFSSDSDTSTSVTLLENQDDILILPYCLPYLTVDSFSPEYRENGVPYNSDIKITFSNYIELNAFSYTDDEIKKLNLTENDELLTENAFDGKSYTYGYKKGSNTKYKNLNISITKTGQNILSYFDAPVIINGKTLLLSLKKDFSSVLLSAIDSSIIEITLSLDEDVFDIHDSGFAENYSNLTFTYAVNTNIISDTPSVDMTFLCDEGTGLLSLQGINNIYTEGELDKRTSVHFLHIANSDKPVQHYSLDVIISVGYRVKAKRGILFRKWATNVLKEYLLRGYVINENRVIVSNENYIQLRNEVVSINDRLLKSL